MPNFKALCVVAPGYLSQLLMPEILFHFRISSDASLPVTPRSELQCKGERQRQRQRLIDCGVYVPVLWVCFIICWCFLVTALLLFTVFKQVNLLTVKLGKHYLCLKEVYHKINKNVLTN